MKLFDYIMALPFIAISGYLMWLIGAIAYRAYSDGEWALLSLFVLLVWMMVSAWYFNTRGHG